MGNRNLCIPGEQASKQAVVKKHQTHQPIFPPTLGQLTRLWSFTSQGVLVCCDSWQHIPVGKWWTGSVESKINYEVGEISALWITVKWFHWNGCVWQRIQTHTAGQSTQTLLYKTASCMGREGVALAWVQGRRQREGLFKICLQESQPLMVLYTYKYWSQRWMPYVCYLMLKNIFTVTQMFYLA